MTENPRLCIDCSADITSRGNRTQRCQSCQRKHRANKSRDQYDLQHPDKKQTRGKKRFCIGSSKLRRGGEERDCKYGHILLPPWGKSYLQSKERPHSTLVDATQINEDESISTIIVDKSGVQAHWNHTISPERINETHQKIGIKETEDQTQKEIIISSFKKWKYWQTTRVKPE